MTTTSSSAVQRDHRPSSSLAFPVVGIGASAGGLQAIKEFFEYAPRDTGMAFVVILHLSPDHQSVAGKIIQDSTRMPVLQVSEGVPIEANHVYVISPAQTLSMDNGWLRIEPPQPRNGVHVAIDLFFRALADVHQERAFCIVLSGTGSDGAVGLTRIKEQGGVTMAQALDDAEFDAMPRAAIATQMVDLVLPVAQMPAKLVELWHNSRFIQLPLPSEDTLLRPTSEREAVAAEQLLQDILGQLRTGTGHDFKHYKRATVLRRIERRMQVTAQPDLRAYYLYLQDRPEETRALLDDMLIGVTNFFRDHEAFDALERDVLPLVVNGGDGPRPEKDEIRVWSAGCSTGEEAYSLAMAFGDRMLADDSQAKLQVFATDIDERAISHGRLGLYNQAIITDVPAARLRQYFLKEEDHFRIRKEVRERVLFAKHSLLSDPPFSQIDLITCRNLLIYLDREVQREILQMFHFALRPGGYLFLGSSESADACPDLFAPLDKRNRIFRAKTGTATSRRTPTMPRGGYVRSQPTIKPDQALAPRKLSVADIHLRAIEKSAPPSLIVDANADILHMTESVGRYLRMVGGELSRNLLTLIHPDLRLEIRTALFQMHQSGAAVRSRQVQVEREGRSYLIELTAQPYKDAEVEGEFALVLIAETELDAAEQHVRAAVQTDNQVLSNLERELQRTKLHLQDTIEQAEVSSEELKASNEEMQAINEELRSATEELETSKEELQSINEELLTVNYELKTKVEETDKINDYLTNLIASTDIATVFVDRSMRIKWFTPRATEIFSMLPVDTGRSLLDITHRLDYVNLAGDAASVFETLNLIEREVSSTDQRWYIVRLLPYRSSEDHIDGTVLTFIDITQRRLAEEELRRSEEAMRQAVSQRSTSLKDEFFAVMSHELKHPLNLIQLNAELLRRLPDFNKPGQVAKSLDTIRDAVSNQARIIDDLLDEARVRTGKLKLMRGPLDLVSVLRGIHNVVNLDELGHEVHLQVPGAAEPALIIDADPTRLEQVLWNLINNALKFTPSPGKIWMVAERDHDMARVRIIDSGVGISAEHLGKVFDLFGQAGGAHSTYQREGLGIGLSLVKQLTEAHGGRVQVESDGIGRGSTFTLWLPLNLHECERPPVEFKEQAGRLKGLTVLLVDDAPEVLETLQMLLEMEEAQVTAFSDPLLALEAASRQLFDLIVSDIGMPKMNGHELMSALRMLPNTKDTPSLALTGYGANDDALKARSAGFTRHLGKPVAYDDLIDALEEIREPLR
ncbi:CheR family methyltransferase [Pseudomonas sp. MWU16-30317]|uniref:CheR family methyltransferase n=1 Tax=Pseudomonas sp. MWU16-30317 TaxID=2878095 RepID=UPI001CFB603D|nr:CheR family methyltransferase [Pseudomonas sp. MWU16-30317]